MTFRPPEKERERLAFSVKPRKSEIFDSWVNRVALRHEVTLAGLFGHLGCAHWLAPLDLARGQHSLPPRYHADCQHLVDELAWAVGITAKRVRSTFIDVPRPWLLPPTLRNFGCPRCWSKDLAAGRPPFVRKEWALCASWWCHTHAIPLGQLPCLASDRRQTITAKSLETLETAAIALARDMRSSAAQLECNRLAIAFLLDGDEGIFRKGHHRYFHRIAANVFHLSAARIRLLAVRHSRATKEARRFEGFLALRQNDLARSGKGFFRRPPPVERRAEPGVSRSRERLTTVNRWECDYHDLLACYAAVRRRDDDSGGCARFAPVTRFDRWLVLGGISREHLLDSAGLAAGYAAPMPENATFAENGPQNRVERVAMSAAPLPI